MTTKELYLKYINSGINNNPVITTEELIELKNKILEIREFLKIYPALNIGLNAEIDSIDNILLVRNLP